MRTTIQIELPEPSMQAARAAGLLRSHDQKHVFALSEADAVIDAHGGWADPFQSAATA
jgi:hypothetical protein